MVFLRFELLWAFLRQQRDSFGHVGDNGADAYRRTPTVLELQVGGRQRNSETVEPDWSARLANGRDVTVQYDLRRFIGAGQTVPADSVHRLYSRQCLLRRRC